MGKFLVTKSSHYEPFTYEDLMKPIVMQQEAHNQAQDTYDKLAMDTAVLENYISQNEGDKRARAMYDNYRQRLSQLQNNLWDYGIGPQTKRDLSAARTAYASDITRIAKAVESRQVASKAYWDAIHKDPSLIVSKDPGLDGLDNYIDNDMYGQNFYSYSGDQFMKEVGTDAQARMNEMLNDPEIIKDERLKGYLLMKSKEGFSSEEVFNATNAVKKALDGDLSGVENLGYGEGILASVLMSHINSTGAREQLKNGNMDKAMFDRLIDYGSSGLSQSIGKTTWSHMNDKIWDDAMQRSRARYAASLTQPQNPTGQRHGYTFDATPVERRSPAYDVVQSKLSDQSKSYANGPVEVVQPDGSVKEYNDAFEATADIFDSPYRIDGRKRLHGLDPGYIGKDSDYKQKVEWTDEKGKKHSYTVGIGDDEKDPKNYHKFVVYTENGKIDQKATDIFRDDAAKHQAHVNMYTKNNPNYKGKLHLIAISPKKEMQLRNAMGIDPTTPTSGLRGLVADLKQVDTPVTVVGTDPGFDRYRDAMTRSIVNAHANAPKDKNGQVDNIYGFRKIDGYGNVSKEVETDIKKVFGDKIQHKITSITYWPEDIVKNNGNQKVIITMDDGNRYEVRADMLGNNLTSTMDYTSERMNGLELPISNPQAVLSLNKKEDAAMTQSMVNFFEAYGIQPPTLIDRDDSGNPVKRYATYRETVTNPEARSQFRSALREFLNNMTSVPRDESNINHIQSVGNSSDNAAAYLDLGF